MAALLAGESPSIPDIFRITLDSTYAKPISGIPSPQTKLFNGEDWTETGGGINTLPAPVILDPSQKWGVRLVEAHILNAICNTGDNDVIILRHVDLDDKNEARGPQVERRASVSDLYIPNLEMLIDTILTAIDRVAVEAWGKVINANVKPSANYKLTMIKGNSLLIPTKMGVALGFRMNKGGVLGVGDNNQFMLFRGYERQRGGVLAYKSRTYTVSYPPNLTLMGPHFLHIHSNVAKPIQVTNKMDTIIGTVPLDFLRTGGGNGGEGTNENRYFSYLASPTILGGLGGLQEVATNELRYLKATLLNENWEVVKFAQSYPEQKCYRLILEFVKGGFQRSRRLPILF